MSFLIKDFLEIFECEFKNKNLILNIFLEEENKINFNINNKDEVDFLYEIIYESETIKLINNNLVVSVWFINDKSSNKDIEIISKDFLEIILNIISKNNSNNSNLKSEKESKNCEKDMNFKNFIERFYNIFPELKNEFSKENFNEIDSSSTINFIKEFINPKIIENLSKGKNKNLLEKIFNHLSKSYINGDENLRCIITMLIFNSINNNEQRKLAETYLSIPMKKVWNASYMFK